MPPRRPIPPIEEPPPPQEPNLEAEYGDPYEGMDFESYDPQEVVRPPAGTPQGTAEETAPELSPFDERYREDFEGLMFLGAVRASFSHVGHKIVIRTLTSLEYMIAARLTKDYDTTLAGPRAQTTAIVALCLQSVDGQSLPIPLGDDGEDIEWAFERFNFVSSKWYPYTIDAIYQRYLLLEDRVMGVLEEMSKKERSQAD